MHHMFTFCLLLVLFYTATSWEDYYWREYNGDIPSDAFPGGKDENGENTYIGQAYIHNFVIAVAQIYPGIKEVDCPCYGVKKATKYIKILCTRSPSKFAWIPTTAQTLNLDTVGYIPILGGTDQHEPNKGALYIGTVMFQGILKVGSVAAYSVEDAGLWFPHDDVEHRATKYHVLVYNDTSVHKKIGEPCVDLRSSFSKL